MTASLKTTLQNDAWANLVEYAGLLSEEENQVQQVVRAFADEQATPSAPRHQDGNLAHREGLWFTRRPDSHRVEA